MAWTASLDVSVGDATKETDYDQLVANVEYLQTLSNAEHNFHISTGTGYHKATTVAGTMTVGVNDAGYDVKFWGDTADKSMLWDTSADKLIITGDAQCTGTATGFGGGVITALNNATANELVTVGATTTELDAEANLIFDGNMMFIGEAAASGTQTNANMTTGLTINQEGADDKLITFKSSDVAHGFTGVAETDSYLTIGKYNATTGGTYINSLMEDTSVNTCFAIDAYGGVASTTHSSAAVGLFDCYVSEHDGANGSVDIAANGMVYTFRGRVGSGNRALFGIDEDGDFQYDGADGGAWDLFDDAQICRAMQNQTAQPETLVRSKWDDMVTYNRETLEEIGVLGSVTPEDRAEGHAGLVNGSQLQRVFMGAHWQAYCDRQELRILIENKDLRITALEAQVQNLLEN